MNYSRAVKTSGSPNPSNKVRERPLGRRIVNTIDIGRRHYEGDQQGEISSIYVEESESNGSGKKRKLNTTAEEEGQSQKRRNCVNRVETITGKQGEKNENKEQLTPSRYTSENNEEIGREVEAICKEQCQVSTKETKIRARENSKEASEKNDPKEQRHRSKVKELSKIIKEDYKGEKPTFKKVNTKAGTYRQPSRQRDIERQQTIDSSKKDRVWSKVGKTSGH